MDQLDNKLQPYIEISTNIQEENISINKELERYQNMYRNTLIDYQNIMSKQNNQIMSKKDDNMDTKLSKNISKSINFENFIDKALDKDEIIKSEINTSKIYKTIEAESISEISKNTPKNNLRTFSSCSNDK